MNKDFEKTYHELEFNHWWFVSRRKHILRNLKLAPGSRLLEVGCSTGVLLKKLSKYRATGIDISDEAVSKAKSWGLDVRKMDAANLTFDEKFDYIIASDCLEHIENDEDALKSWHSSLNENGRVLIYVPAYMFLWSEHDRLNLHYRRYNLKELQSKVEKAGFTVLKKGYWNSLLFFPTFLFRRFDKGSLNKPPTIIDWFLREILWLENFFWFPFGVSCWLEAKK